MTNLRISAAVRCELPPICGDDSVVGGSIFSGGSIGIGVIIVVQEVGS